MRKARSLLIIIVTILALVGCSYGKGMERDIEISAEEEMINTKETTNNQVEENIAEKALEDLISLEREEDIEELISLIENYNNSWIKYANEKDDEIFDYVFSGSNIEDKINRFHSNGFTEKLLRHVISEIEFDDNSAEIKVFEVLRKEKENKFTFKEYEWIYLAENTNGKWLLKDFNKSDGLLKKNIPYGKVQLIINSKEYIYDDWIFFASSNDKYKLYKVRRDGSELTKLFDEIVKIIDIRGEYIFFITLNDGIQLYMYDDIKGGANELEWAAIENEWAYYSNTDFIYRVKVDGSQFERVFTRELSGVEQTITSVRAGYIYFYIISEDGKSEYRIKVDGSGLEHLGTLRSDD